MKSWPYAKLWCAVGVVLLLIFVWWQFGGHSSSASGGSSNLGTVRKQDLTQRVTISGQIWPKHRLDIKPPFNGYIARLYVKIGDRLKRGEPIITFSPSLSSGEVNFPIRAGFDGVVTQVLKSEGEYVTEQGDQNQLVGRFEDLSDMYVLGSVAELDIAKVKVGQEALIKVSSLVGETFRGVISEMSLSAKDKERYGSSATEFQLRAILKSHDPRLLPGMSTVMDIISAQRSQVLTLPHEYIQEDDKGYFATTEKGETRRLTLGLQTAEAVEIEKGLSEGERVRAVDFLSLPKLED
jgi:multidrug efflux pump subunit AcrA (membrane-fusion protein)